MEPLAADQEGRGREGQGCGPGPVALGVLRETETAKHRLTEPLSLPVADTGRGPDRCARYKVKSREP